jgi:hypothetical protein
VLEFEKRWNRFSRPVGCSWRVDETYIPVKHQWCYRNRSSAQWCLKPMKSTGEGPNDPFGTTPS